MSTNYLAWAAAWLAIGLVLEPFQGGIRKDPSTFSYYFVTSGLSLFVWFGLVWLEQNKVAVRVSAWVAMYSSMPWAGVLRGGIYTCIVAWITSQTSRRGWFWKT